MRVFNLSSFIRRIGVVSTTFIVAVYLGATRLMMDVVLDVFSGWPIVAGILFCGLLLLWGYGGLVGFWVLVVKVRDWHSGFRVRWIEGSNWVYEEPGFKDGIDSVRYVREIRGRGYPQPCTIRIVEPGFLGWANERQAEIATRICNSHGREISGEIVLETCSNDDASEVIKTLPKGPAAG